MQINPSIILSGQQPDFVNTLARSTQAAQMANQNRDQNALRQLFQTQGPQIMAGEGNALNSLARIDPNAALGIQGARQDMQAQQQRMGILSAAEKRAVQEHAMRLSAAERQQQAAQVQQGIMQGISLYRAGDLNGLNQMLTSVGEAPLPSLDAFPGLAAKYNGVLEVLTELRDYDAGPKPADEYQRYVQEETAAGRKPLTRIDFAKAKQKQSRISVSPDGTMTIAEGGAASERAWGKAAGNQIEERILNSGAMLSRLNDTRALFKPEYLEFATRAGVKWGQFKDKMGTASAEQQALVAEFARFKTEAFNNLNTGLKELSGAAVTPQEAERLLQQLPNVGSGVFDGDSPVEFQAKMEQSIQQQKLAVARYNLWRVMGQTGNPWDMGSLDSVPDMMNKRGAQIMDDLRAQGLTDKKVIFDMAEKQLREEVGL